MPKLYERIKTELIERQKNELLRNLTHLDNNNIDFCSNDYLGLAQNQEFKRLVLNELTAKLQTGSTGSRLISGNLEETIKLEEKIARFHGFEKALLFPSGYQANIGVLSCLPSHRDVILYDELCHASLKDGIRLSLAKKIPFKHNDVADLRKKIKQQTAHCFIVVEAVYSMDGDIAPFDEIRQTVEETGASLIIDEAHSGGIYGEQGKGLTYTYRLNEMTVATIITFGKAFACQGAAVLCNSQVYDYLINFSRPFIYTTAISPLLTTAIDVAYEYLQNNQSLRQELFHNIKTFKKLFKEIPTTDTAIQKIIIGDNARLKQISEDLKLNGINALPIRYPTVKKGSERLRIVIHSFNDENQLKMLHNSILKFL